MARESLVIQMHPAISEELRISMLWLIAGYNWMYYNDLIIKKNGDRDGNTNTIELSMGFRE